MQRRGNLSRRQLLTMSGLALTGAFLPSLLSRQQQARAAGAFIPRIVIMTTEHQVMPDIWRMPRGNDVGKPFEYALGDVPNAELSSILGELASHKGRLLAVDGLSLASGIPNTGFFQGHALSSSNLLSAAGYDPDDDQFTPRGTTVDQVIAARIADPDLVPSLELGTHKNRYVATGFLEKPPLENSPSRLSERLFPAGVSETPTRDELLSRESTSVLDLTAREYEALLPRVSREDREKLDLHRQMIRDLERQQRARREIECTEPNDPWDKPVDKLDRVGQFAKLVGAAFACDLTRVVTVQVSQLANEEFGGPPGDVHQDVAHQADKSESAAENMNKYTMANARIFARLVDEIGAYSDQHGNLLDNTLVVWMAEHGLTTKAHTATEHGALIAGNINGFLKSGRYVSLPRETPYPKKDKEPMGVPHSHLLVTLMQACGLAEDTIGLPDYEVWDGSRVSLAGPIAQLLA